MTRPLRILLGVSGSIAAYKAVELLRLLQKRGASVQVALTASGQKFVAPLTFQAISGQPVLTDVFHLPAGDIEHVERAHEVDAVLVAPASANLMARLAMGMADDPLTTTILSTTAPVWLAPAMETGMWQNPATQANLATLQERGLRILGPGAGDLASGRSGIGRMLEPAQICELFLEQLQGPQPLAGKKVVLTAGPTWEALDPVRILTNRSTGAMGIAIAEAAAALGAQVCLVLGPTHLSAKAHANIETIRVESAAQMLQAARDSLEGCNVLIGTAAVSDFRPAEAQNQKLKRSDPRAHALALTENPDLLKTLSAELRSRNPQAVVVGFAAETQNVEENALGKLTKKGCHMVVGNYVGVSKGFGPGQTEVAIVRSQQEPQRFGPASKKDVGRFIIEEAAKTLEELSKDSSSES